MGLNAHEYSDRLLEHEREADHGQCRQTQEPGQFHASPLRAARVMVWRP